MSTAPRNAGLAATHRDNNFNFLRLFLATLVLFSHSFALIEGQANREILVWLTGTTSLGGVAVDGFFVLSGFLIVQSWERNPQFLAFFKNRVLRIYPGFLAASFLSAFVAGPLGANAAQYFARFDYVRYALSALLLQMPYVPATFAGTPHPGVNGSMWSIRYEFRCYLLVALLGMCGLIAKRQRWLGLSAAVFILALTPGIAGRVSFPGSHLLFADFPMLVSLFAFFAVGGCFYLFRDRIRYKTAWGLLALVLLALCMCRPETTYAGLVLFGSYVLFSFAFARIPALERFKTGPDISYGTYLYGYPIQKLLAWYVPSLGPWPLFALSCVLSFACGWLSWHLVEQPFLRLKARKTAQAPPPQAAPVQTTP